MSRKNLLIVGAIGLLVILNVWRWLPEDRPRAAPAGRTGDSELQDLQLRVGNADVTERVMRRDLFHRNAPAARPAGQIANPARRPSIAAAPVKSPEELALESAQTEFAAIRVIGIVFRSGRGEAYLEIGGKSEMVGIGDTFGSFKVTAIRQDSVELQGTETTAGGKISLAGS